MSLISFVIPTRDRPEMVHSALSSLASQTSNNFDVIVADNGTTDSCRRVVETFETLKISYLRPERPLGMTQNWEFATQEATGDYVSVLIDKYALYPFAVELFELVVSSFNSPDIVSWLCDGVLPQDSAAASKVETDLMVHGDKLAPGKPLAFNPSEELARRRSVGSYHRSLDMRLYFRGKICSGAYRKDLINLVREKFGAVFPPANPDFTSCALGLASAKSAVDMNIVISQFAAYPGNGEAVHSQPGRYREFLQENFCWENKKNLPIPHLWSSAENWVAWDYYADSRLGLSQNFPGLGWNRLMRDIPVTLSSFAFSSHDEKSEQMNLLKQFTDSRAGHVPRRNLSVRSVQRVVLSIFRRFLGRILRRTQLLFPPNPAVRTVILRTAHLNSAERYKRVLTVDPAVN